MIFMSRSPSSPGILVGVFQCADKSMLTGP
jgi:hypothetical protein